MPTVAIIIRTTRIRHSDRVVGIHTDCGHFIALSFDGGIIFDHIFAVDDDDRAHRIFRDVASGDVPHLIADHIRDGSVDRAAYFAG